MRVHIRVNLSRYFERKAGLCPASVEDGAHPARLSALRAEIDSLTRRRRSSSEFRPWKPDMFYYLFAAVASGPNVGDGAAGGQRHGAISGPELRP